MKLNNEGKDELRAKIVEQLQEVPDGQRIHIDKDLLDDLIFFKGKNKKGILIKVPIWTGEFLRKIDLSEISFENVLFQTGFDDYGDSIDDVMDAENVSRFVNDGNENFPQYHVPSLKTTDTIDFSYTNANIDFSKIYGTTIVGCNFEGLDFSKSNGECIEEIYVSNFSNTNIRINFNHEYLTLMSSDFSNNDFSDVTVDARWFNYEDDTFRLNGCNFSNTGLKINYTSPNIPPIYYEESNNRKKLYELFENGNISEKEYILQDGKLREKTSPYSTDVFYKEAISEQIKAGNLTGCYINDKKISSLEEREAIAQEKREEYEKMKSGLIDSTVEDIGEQISSMKK